MRDLWPWFPQPLKDGLGDQFLRLQFENIVGGEGAEVSADISMSRRSGGTQLQALQASNLALQWDCMYLRRELDKMTLCNLHF